MAPPTTKITRNRRFFKEAPRDSGRTGAWASRPRLALLRGGHSRKARRRGGGGQAQAAAGCRGSCLPARAAGEHPGVAARRTWVPEAVLLVEQLDWRVSSGLPPRRPSLLGPSLHIGSKRLGLGVPSHTSRGFALLPNSPFFLCLKRAGSPSPGPSAASR